MLNLGIYAIYDAKSDSFDTPFFAANDLFAERRFNLMLRENNSMMNIYKDEFTLYSIAKFIIATGEIVVESRKEIVSGKSIIIEK